MPFIGMVNIYSSSTLAQRLVRHSAAVRRAAAVRHSSDPGREILVPRLRVFPFRGRWLHVARCTSHGRVFCPKITDRLLLSTAARRRRFALVLSVSIICRLWRIYRYLLRKCIIF